MDYTIQKLAESQLEIRFGLSAEEFVIYYEKAVLDLGKDLKIEGFRPGYVPKEIIEKTLGKEKILSESANLAINENYFKVISENNIDTISQPEIEIIKIAQSNPFEFKAKVFILPEVKLPDYKKIASKAKGKEFSVAEEEVQDAINYLQKSRAKMTIQDRAAEKKDFVQIEYSNKDINAGKEVQDQFILGEAGFIHAGIDDDCAGGVNDLEDRDGRAQPW